MNRQPPRSDLRSWPGLLPAAVFLLAGGLLGFTGASTVSGQGLMFIEDPRRLIIYGGAYVWALGWLIAHPAGVKSLALGAWPWCAMLVYVAASSLWSTYPMKVVINSGHLAGGTIVAAAAVLSVRGTGWKLTGLVIVAFGLVLVLSLVAVVAGLPNALDPESGRWAGTTGNANTLGSVAAIMCWAAVYMLLTASRAITKVPAVAAIGLGGVALWGSGSATSLVVAVLMCAGLCWLLLGRRQEDGGMLQRIVLGLALAGVAIVGAMAFAPKLLGLETGLHALGRSTTLTGRTELWALGWDRFLSRPVMGYGFDSLASLLSGSAIQVGQLHNGYLDLLIQGGMIAGMLFALLALRTLWRAFQLSKVRGAESVMCAMLIVGALAHNITESSIARPVTNLWFLFVLAVLTIERHYAWRDSSIPETAAHDYSHTRPARAPALPNLLR